MKNLFAALAASLLLLAPIATQAASVDLSAASIQSMMRSHGTIVAMDRTTTYTGMNPQSLWVNLDKRNERLGVGDSWWNMLAGANASFTGLYSNATVSPVTGLFVAVAPTTANTEATLYQLAVDDANSYGGFPAGVGTFLPADSTLTVLQGRIPASTATANIGPMVAGSTGGQSVSNLIECKVNTSDTTSSSIQVVSSGGSVTPTTANRDRVDRWSCQFKSSSSGVSPTTPTVDAGFVAIAAVVVPNGTSTVTSGMITAQTAQQFGGFTLLSGSGIPVWTGALPIVQGGTGSTTQNFVDLSNTQTVGGAKTFSSAPTMSGANLTTGTVNIGSSGAQTGVLPVANGGTGSSSQNFVDLSTVQTVAGNKTFSGGNTVIASQLNVTNSNGLIQLGTASTNNSSGGVEIGSGVGGFSQLSVSSASTLGAINCGLLGLAVNASGYIVCLDSSGDLQLNGNLYLGTSKVIANPLGQPLFNQVSSTVIAIQTAAASLGNINFGNQASGNAYGSVSTGGYTPPSARRFKYDIQPYQQDALSLIDRTDTEQFCYLVTHDGKAQPPCTEPIYGIVADDSPWPIANKTHDGFQSTQATGVLIRAVQQLHSQIKADEAHERLLDGLVAFLAFMVCVALAAALRRSVAPQALILERAAAAGVVVERHPRGARRSRVAAAVVEEHLRDSTIAELNGVD